MPKSKRDRKVSLTQTKKKGYENKGKLIDKIREEIEKYSHVFVFSVANMRNGLLKDIRQEWNDSRFFFGKIKVMSVALGKAKECEFKQNLHLLSKRLTGQSGLLLTNRTKKEVLNYFSSYGQADYARAGNTAERTVVVNEGPLDMFPFNMEPELRQLGLPTKLVKGVIHLRENYTICLNNDTLTSVQSRLLKHFGFKMAEFRIVIDSLWCKDGTFEVFSATKSNKLKKTQNKCEQNEDVEML